VSKPYRIGMIVPSSNTTMETEIPAMLRSREEIAPERFTFHSSRMRMREVNADELARMDQDSLRCAIELSDARCDLLAYACLIAIMCQGVGYHERSERRLKDVTAENGVPTPVISSAGALIQGIQALEAKRIGLVAPYLAPLTAQVIGYIADSGIEVTDSVSLEISDNVQVGRLDPTDLVDIYKRLDLSRADALVLSACVQMPSLPAIQVVEDELGLPVLSAATATVFRILRELELRPIVPRAGRLLSGDIAAGSRTADAASQPAAGAVLA
jgi:maleate isomerase